MVLNSVRRARRRWLRARSDRILRPERPGRRPLIEFSATRIDEDFRITVVGDSEFFIPFRDSLVVGLHNAGAKAEATTDLEAIDVDDAPHAVLVIGPHDHVMRKHHRRLSRSVLAAIQTEQMPTQRQAGYQLSSKRLEGVLAWSPFYDLVIDWSRDAIPMLRRLGLNALHVPHGHLPLGATEPTGQSLIVETHDLVFLGGLGGPQKRRRHLIKALSERFSVHPATGTKVWGEAKVRALCESRLVLNLHSEQSLAFASPRFFETLSLGRPLISEGVADPWPFVPGVDYIEAALPGLSGAIKRALSDDGMRRRIAESGLSRTLEHPAEDVAGRILSELLSLHRAISD